MSFQDVRNWHTPMVIINLTNGGFITANPGGSGIVSGIGKSIAPMENPEEIEDEKGADWARSKVPGMSHPRYQFIAGDPRLLRFKLEMHGGWDPWAVVRTCRWLQSLEYPTRLGTVTRRPPPICMIVYGLQYAGIKVVFSNVKPRYHTLFEGATLYSLRATVEMVAEEWVEESCIGVSQWTGVSA